jgi:ubiquinone/menaquinone biosynthesis C-methylase UbiE
MSTSEHSVPKEPGTLVAQGVSGDEELYRLRIQDQMLTDSMGGVLPEQPDPTRFDSVLDIGCGTASWLLDLARIYPHISRLVGVDINAKVLDYARAQARELQVEDRVEFHQMDVLSRVEFPDESFDLVNERQGINWLHTEDWPVLLQECQRVAKPGGIIRVTEISGNRGTNSSAFARLYGEGGIVLEATYRAGLMFTSQGNGLTAGLARLLPEQGLQQMQTHDYVLEYPATTPEGRAFAENCQIFARIMVPWMQQWIQLPDDYEDIYQQMVHDIQQPTFYTSLGMTTFWGIRSPAFSLPTER